MQKLVRLDSSLNEEALYRCTRALDADGSGTITLDEFLEFFGQVADFDAQMHNAEDDLEDEMWPDWLSKEGKLAHAQQLLIQMHQVLEVEHGITAEQAFGIYDLKDTGECSVDEFHRILRIFFGEVVPDAADIDFLMRMASKRAGRVDYRDFCKYLSKRLVRSLKNSGAGTKSDDKGSGSAIPHEVERPLKKEASLTYVLRKAAELELDLR